jgi:hypothetical protein
VSINGRFCVSTEEWPKPVEDKEAGPFHWVSPILAGFIAWNPPKSRRDDRSEWQKYRSQIGNPGLQVQQGSTCI